MDRLDLSLVPAPFGLNNNASICYLNSFLQVLASCSAFNRLVFKYADALRATRTGAAMADFCQAYMKTPHSADLCMMSSRVLTALTADLTERRPRFRFGSGQECANEALDLILDMMEAPDAENKQMASKQYRTIISDTFFHRFRSSISCSQCNKVVSDGHVDESNIMRPVWMDKNLRMSTSREFVCELAHTETKLNDYVCPCCKQVNTTIRHYSLEMVPEIMFCMFNVFDNPLGQGERRVRYFPKQFQFWSTTGELLKYKLVGQIEHSGSMHGGHYKALALRGDGAVYLLNDSAVGRANFVSTELTYMVVYHYDGCVPADIVIEAAKKTGCTVPTLPVVTIPVDVQS